MQYGYFDDDHAEYVITRPDTPTPWINYLGFGKFGSIISQCAGGYCFDRDPRNRRVTRYRYNAVPVDQPGRYLYLRDKHSGAYWSASWQPVKASLDHFECRHGLGYTRIQARKNGVESEVCFFVPDGAAAELWNLKLRCDRPCTLQVFTYVEFCHYDAVQDQEDVDWVQQIGQGRFKDQTILFYNPMENGFSYFWTDSLVKSFDTGRDNFVGPYRDLGNPIALERGTCSNQETYRGNTVGCFEIEVNLLPGQDCEINFMLGVEDKKTTISKSIRRFGNPKGRTEAWKALNDYWTGFRSNQIVHTPDADMNRMLNIWNQYQCKCTFNWSRFVSLYQLGIRRGMGTRDSAQDCLGVMHTMAPDTRFLMVNLLKCQFPEGDAHHQYYPLTGQGDSHGYSDDHLWIILSVCQYLKETGDFSFLKEKITYAKRPPDATLKGVPRGKKTSDTVLGHLEQAIAFSLKNVGPHGITKAGFADWNDTINLDQGKGKAESVFSAMLLGAVILELIGLYEFIKKSRQASALRAQHRKLSATINKHCWDGAWYVRAWDDTGRVLGSKKSEKGKIFINTQSWAVLGATASTERGRQALQSAHDQCNTQEGVLLCYPSYTEFDPSKGGVSTYPPGAKENGGIFLHSNPWLMIAHTQLGDGDRAYQYYRQILPCHRNADRYEVEPYVYCQNILGKEHPQHGLGRNSWLTGTAAWNYVAATQYILGIRPGYAGLQVKPVLPSAWNGFDIERVYRGTRYVISVRKPAGKSAQRVANMRVDGKLISGTVIPPSKKKRVQVDVDLAE